MKRPNPTNLQFVWALILMIAAGLPLHAQTLQASAARLAVALPPTPVVREWVADNPAVRGAQASAESERRRADIVEQGAAEFSARISQQSRRVTDTAEQYNETLVSLERPFRWWGKSGLDAKLAERSRSAADWALGDAWHETSRTLLSLWLDVERQVQRVSLSKRQVELATELHRQAQARLRRGDISQLDSSLAQAELQRTQATLNLAQAAEAGARARLVRSFPGSLAALRDAPAQPSVPALDVLQSALRDLPPWTELQQEYLEHNHALQLVRVEVDRQRIVAQRADRDRYPDPTLGVFAASERGGNERIMGVSISIPLSGQTRQNTALAAQAQARSADERLALTEAGLTADLEARYASLTPLLDAAQALEEAARTQTLAAEKSLRAYQLGEHTMTELVQNRRLAADQTNAAEAARLDAFQAVALLYLDLHVLWDFD